MTTLLPAAPAAPKTNPSLRMERLEDTTPRRLRAGGGFNLLILGAAAIITIIAAGVYLTQTTSTPPLPTAVVEAHPTATEALSTATNPPPPTDAPSPIPPSPIPVAALEDNTVPPDVVAELLRQPGITAPPADAFFRMQNPYTIAPVRARSGVISYRIRPGDNLDKIAAYFGLSLDTLIWNNDGIYVNRLIPGEELKIMPENGILYKTTGEESLQSIADKFKVSPYAIIDSEYNPHLQRTRPATLLTPGIEVFAPGGVSDKKAIYWDPGIEYAGGTNEVDEKGRPRSLGGTVSFGGGPGSCGAQPNVGGSGSFAIPLPPTYTVQRGFTSYHSGIDLSTATGTTVFAADGGTVIFAGWSNWGYGNAIVLAHGRFLTLYGHLNAINVSCGQSVGRGAPIGAVGSTGNSSGPHLHFEVRVGQQPDNPENYLAF